jgi:1-acyl-sn-glycerol-3-phosphate acyltransferase
LWFHQAYLEVIMLSQVFYKLGRPAVTLYAGLMFDMDVAWEEPLPRGPKIIAPNHPSTTDPFLIAGLVTEPTSILIDDRLFKVPVFGRYLHLAGHVPVVEGNGRKAFEAAKGLLEAGQNVAIFPEGAVSPLAGGLHPPRTGAARLALSTGVPVIPIGIHLPRERIHVVESSYSGISATGRWYLRGPYAMTVGTPMVFGGDVEDRECVREVGERIIQRIAHLAQLSARRADRSIRRSTLPLRQLPGEVT